jgi:hypothetical protein
MEHGSDMGAGFVVIELLFFVIGIAIVIIPFWKIYAKAGFSKWLSLLMIVPLVNLIVLYVVSFSTWPAHRGGE